ncbi:MAG: leucine-rich repeat domain-containing protein, partial [Promethearchaeota archaeon]
SVQKIDSDTFGFNVTEGRIIEVGLANKKLSDLPENFSNLVNLRRLTLKNCGLERLPEALINFSNLEFVDLSGNPLSELTDSLKSWIESFRTAGKTIVQ